MSFEEGYSADNANMMSNAVKGAAAGALAVWMMDRLDWFFFTHEDQQARRRTEQVRPGGLDPAHVSANRAAHLAGAELHPAQPHPAGIATHYALGIGPAAIYGAFREQLPVSRQGQDLLYGIGLGVGLFLIQDEGLNQAMGLSGKQKNYPWQAHARGLAAHLTFGLVVNTALNLMGAPRPMPKPSGYFDQYAEQQEEEFMPQMPVSKAEETRVTTLH